jgi:Cu/Ag efflux protein CusF
MKNQSLVVVAILTVFLLGSVTTGWACKSAGPNTHVGNVTMIDAKAKTFTIQDAETDQPMTFAAADTILKELKVQDRVMVGFKEEKGQMVAVDIRS